MTSGRKQTSKVFEANNKHKRTFRRLFEVLQKIRTYSLRTLEVALKNRHLLEDFTSASRRTEYSKDFQVAIDILLFDVLYPNRHRVQITKTMQFFYQIVKKPTLVEKTPVAAPLLQRTCINTLQQPVGQRGSNPLKGYRSVHFSCSQQMCLLQRTK